MESENQNNWQASDRFCLFCRFGCLCVYFECLRIVRRLKVWVLFCLHTPLGNSIWQLDSAIHQAIRRISPCIPLVRFQVASEGSTRRGPVAWRANRNLRSLAGFYFKVSSSKFSTCKFASVHLNLQPKAHQKLKTNLKPNRSRIKFSRLVDPVRVMICGHCSSLV